MLDVTDKQDHWRVLKLGRDTGALYARLTPEDLALKTHVGTTRDIVEHWRRSFKSFHDMPTKTQEAVACLKMGKNGERVEGIGRRVSMNTFWLDDSPAILAEYEEEKK